MEHAVTNIIKVDDCFSALKINSADFVSENGFSIARVQDFDFNYPILTPTFRPDFYSITIAIDCECSAMIGGESYRISPGEIVLTKPDTFISWWWYAAVNAYTLTFTSTFLEKYAHMSINNFALLTSTNAILLSLTEKEKSEFNSLCERCFLEASAPDSFLKNELIGNYLLNLLLKFFELKNLNVPVFESENINKSMHVINRFFAVLEKNFSTLSMNPNQEIFRTKDYAQMLNIEPNYLSKLVRMFTGKTINGWIREKTIDDVKYLLLYSDKSLKEISLHYCFFDLNYFYSVFKKHTGASPLHFRQIMQKESFQVNNYSTGVLV